MPGFLHNAFKFTKIVEPRQRIIQCGLPLALREIVDIILHSQKFQCIRNSLVPVAEAEIIARRAVVFQHRIPVKPCLKAHGIHIENRRGIVLRNERHGSFAAAELYRRF